MQIANFCVILRRNSFSITERRGFKITYDIRKPAASGGYLKLLAFENDLFLVVNIFEKSLHSEIISIY